MGTDPRRLAGDMPRVKIEMEQPRHGGKLFFHCALDFSGEVTTWQTDPDLDTDIPQCVKYHSTYDEGLGDILMWSTDNSDGTKVTVTVEGSNCSWHWKTGADLVYVVMRDKASSNVYTCEVDWDDIIQNCKLEVPSGIFGMNVWEDEEKALEAIARFL